MATTIGTKTDAEIQRDVLDELKWDARVQPNEIGVAVKDGVATMIGWVGLLNEEVRCRGGGTAGPRRESRGQLAHHG